MKTFLWTTLFWIVAAIAGLLCLGFGNLGTQVLDNTWMIKFLPETIQTRACEPVVAETLKGIDWCEQAQEAECNLVTTVETGDLQGIQASIEALLSGQALMYDEMKESLNSLNEKIAGEASDELNNLSDSESKLAKEQKKKELQEQLNLAVAELRFEDAAAIRDQIKELD